MNGTKRGLVTAGFEAERVSAPAGLEAYTFAVGDDEYCLFEFDFGQIPIPPQLTRAERAVTTLVLEGRSNEEIARSRRTSSCTVANQLQAIYGKLGISGRAELIAYCVEQARLATLSADQVRQ